MLTTEEAPVLETKTKAGRPTIVVNVSLGGKTFQVIRNKTTSLKIDKNKYLVRFFNKDGTIMDKTGITKLWHAVALVRKIKATEDLGTVEVTENELT